MLGEGTIDIYSLSKDLKKYFSHLILSAEVKQNDDKDYIEYIKRNYIALVDLESKIITSSK